MPRTQSYVYKAKFSSCSTWSVVTESGLQPSLGTTLSENTGIHSGLSYKAWLLGPLGKFGSHEATQSCFAVVADPGQILYMALIASWHEYKAFVSSGLSRGPLYPWRPSDLAIDTGRTASIPDIESLFFPVKKSDRGPLEMPSSSLETHSILRAVAANIT